MNIPISKGLKPFTIKAIIIVMSILYMLGPAHLEVNKLLHFIAHTIEMPDTILSHQKKSTAIKTHQNNHHKDAIVQHDHEIIELVQKILKGADNRSKSPDTNLTIDRIDKHITVKQKIDPEEKVIFFLESMRFNLEIENKLCNGYPSDFRDPPQIFKGALI